MKKIKMAFDIIRLLKNWPTYFKEIFLKNAKNNKTNLCIYELRNGIRFKIRTSAIDRFFLKSIWINRIYDPPGFGIKENDNVIDIGANIGLFSIYASNLSKHGTILGFEPEQENFELLVENIKINSKERVIPIKKGVASKSGSMKLYLANVNTSAHSFYKDTNQDNAVMIETLSLPNIVDQYNISPIDFLKLNVEGAEYDIILNCPEDILKKINTISMECHEIDGDQDPNTLKTFLQNNGFYVKLEHGQECMLYAKRNIT